MQHEALIRFREQHNGAFTRYKFRPADSDEQWQMAVGQIDGTSVKVDTKGYTEWFVFPSEDFEYMEVEVEKDGAYSKFNPSPNPSRMQSRAASQQRENAIAELVATTAAQSQGERNFIREQNDAHALRASQERDVLLQTTLNLEKKGTAERREMLDIQRQWHEASAKERNAMMNTQGRVLDALDRLTAATQATQQAMEEIANQMRQQRQATPQQQTTQQHMQHQLLQSLQQQLAPQQQQPQPQQTAADIPETTIGRRPENDIFYVTRWNFSSAETVHLKKLEIQQFFEITLRSSPYRLRAWNSLSAWMDLAFANQLMSPESPMDEVTAGLGKVLMENLRATVAHEDKRINPRALYDATSNLANDTMGDAMARLERSATRNDRGRSRTRTNFGNNNNTRTSNSNNANGQQGNLRGPARQ